MKITRLVTICLMLLLAAALCAAEEAVAPQWWGGPPGPRPLVQGTVANVSATNIAVNTKEGLKPFTVDDKTKVLVRGQKATIADVKVGDPVVVKFKLVTNNIPLALGILVPKPTVGGEIVSIQGNVIIVRPVGKAGRPRAAAAARPAGRRPAGRMHAAGVPSAEPAPGTGAEQRIVVNENTKYHSHGYQGTLADLRVGYRIGARGAMNGQDFVADEIDFAPALAKGAVTAVENGIITVKTIRQLTLQLQPSGATVVLIRPRVGPNVKGTIADVKVGAPVNVGFHPNQTGPCPLLWVDVLTGT